jgi:excisionase family DNA binding protein
MSATAMEKKYFTTKEACQLIGISRSTLLRWINDKMLDDASYRDRRGWRMFTKADIERIKAEANKVKENR